MNGLISCSVPQVLTDYSLIIAKTRRDSVKTSHAKLCHFFSTDNHADRYPFYWDSGPAFFCLVLEKTVCAHHPCVPHLELQHHYKNCSAIAVGWEGAEYKPQLSQIFTAKANTNNPVATPESAGSTTSLFFCSIFLNPKSKSSRNES